MKLRIFILITLLSVSLFSSSAMAQVSDEVRRDIIQENKDEIKSINEEILRQKEMRTAEKARKKAAFQKKIERSQKLKAIQKRHEIISESEELLKTIEERTKFVSEKRWRYEELIKIYAEKPIDDMSIEEQEETANQFLASATTELLELLKLKKIQDEKKAKGEEAEEIVADQEMLVQLNQYMQLAKRIESYKPAQQQKIIKKQEAIVRSTKELIELLKQEAIRRAKLKALAKAEAEEPKMQLKKFEGIIGLHYGYDDNINNDRALEGGQFVRNYFGLDWLPSFNQYYKAQVGVWYLGDSYVDDQDVTFKIATGNASFKWYPKGNDNFVIQPGFEFSDNYYPNDETLSTKENSLFLHTKYKFWKRWFHELNYDGLWTYYDENRLARDVGGSDRSGVALKKRRHSIRYNLQFPLGEKTTFKVKQRGSRQTSNDVFNDFYHYYSYKVTGELGQRLTKKLYMKPSFSYERKDYTDRIVTVNQVAQEDRIYTTKVTLFYFWKENWMLNYTWTLTKADSNAAVYDYRKNNHVFGIYYTF